jgi:hypothetical protein
MSPSISGVPFRRKLKKWRAGNRCQPISRSYKGTARLRRINKDEPQLAIAVPDPPAHLVARKRLQRGVHISIKQLEADIRAFIDRHNQNPRPFKWIDSADQILASVKRFCHSVQNTFM